MSDKRGHTEQQTASVRKTAENLTKLDRLKAEWLPRIEQELLSCANHGGADTATGVVMQGFLLAIFTRLAEFTFATQTTDAPTHETDNHVSRLYQGFADLSDPASRYVLKAAGIIDRFKHPATARMAFEAWIDQLARDELLDGSRAAERLIAILEQMAASEREHDCSQSGR
ncbi:hypothetical protein [Paraburkholderia phenoliruptrix]|uniref:hypothetical protein n=1 Tax=Paraburkholderia phenoliruptrix TaxID=252970 RepID=UPI0028699516|nr:hypothetical protein [Paraburkholderia phenoliruptrix]WMY11002.1 hypothetical protein P3F88_30465 [Paraburkholderia phenoliruptrix]